MRAQTFRDPPAAQRHTLDFFPKNRYKGDHLAPSASGHGGYGVTVNTEVCGAFDSGSIPDSRPHARTPFRGLLRVGGYSEQTALLVSGIERRSDVFFSFPRVEKE